MSQPMRALEVANRNRLGATRRRQEIALLPLPEGLREVAATLRNPTTEDGSGQVGFLLRAPNRIGKARASAALYRLGILPNSPIRELSEQQRLVLAHVVEAGMKSTYRKRSNG